MTAPADTFPTGPLPAASLPQNLGTPNLGTPNLGTPNLGTPNLGTPNLGPSDLAEQAGGRAGGRSEARRTRPLRRRQRSIAQYSRFVAWMKLVLPTAAAGLLLLVAAWPHLQAGLERVRMALPPLDLSEARDLRMVNARYTGVDRHGRPFTVTADVAREPPDSNDLVALEGPKGDMTTESGTWIAITAQTGIYQSQAQLLDLFGDVNLFQDRGNEFHTDSAHMNMGAGTAEGQDPVEGQGTFGHITAEGFRIIDHGDTIFFTGKSHLRLDMRQKEAP